MNLGKIAAIVVTYNRQHLLAEVIECMKHQTRKPDALIIVNNNSTDGTIDVVRAHQSNSSIDIVLINLPENIGGAGGFYEGAKKAYEDGFDAMWFMDDDTMPQPDALHFLESDLLNFENTTKYIPGFICSTVLWKNDDLCEMNIPSPIWDWPRFIHTENNVALVGSCSFVSVLVRREKVRDAGYPVPEFFIWYDDVEYTKRLAGIGYPGIMSFRSKVNHHLVENKGVNYSLINSGNVWKYKFGIRNEGAVILRSEGWMKFCIYAAGKIRDINRTSISRKMKLVMIKACFSAIFFDYKITKP